MSRNAIIQITVVALLGWLAPVSAQEFNAPHPTNSTARIVVAQGENLLEHFLPYDDRVEQTFNLGLLQFTRTTSVANAWRTLVSSNDTVGIKIFSEPGPLCGTRPAVVKAAVRGLLASGVPAGKIILWDKHTAKLRNAGYFQIAQQLGIKIAGAAESGYDTNTFYLPESPVIGALVWGDVEFGNTNSGVGKKSFVSKLISQRITKIISIAPLINENGAGICGHFYNLGMGSIDNTRRYEGDRDRLAAALPEIYALPVIGDRVALHITDALLGQYQGGPASYVQYCARPQQIWFSRDPVALDTLGLNELLRERRNANSTPQPSNFEIYTNAALLQLGVRDPAKIQIERISQK